MPSDLKSRYILAAACLVSFGAGIMVMYLHAKHLDEFDTELRERGGYTYISPLLACSETEGLLPKQIRAAEAQVQELIEKRMGEGELTDASVYYRDLTNGPWFGINEDEVFVPGSLLKVPLMMAYLKQLEEKPDTARQDVYYQGHQSPAIQNTKIDNPLVAGEHYTPDELLERMIIESDNESAHLLNDVVENSYVGELYTQLGLPAPVAGSDYAIRIRDYATFFRVLYNSTYLSPESSERALALLARTDFDVGIAAGVPAGTPVANKFGERRYGGEGYLQLHDCGIVYAPKRPYMLCVMTRGGSMEGLSTTISDISRIVYDRVSSY